MSGLYDGTSGLSLGSGLYRGNSGLWSGASGFQNGSSGLDFTTGTLPSGTTITRASTGTYFDNSLVMQSAAIDTARFDYLGGVGLLLEPAATNNVPRSAEFDNAVWNPVNATITPNTTTAPDGTLTADTVAVTSNGFSQVYQATGAPPAGARSRPLYVKAGTATWIWLLGEDAGNLLSWFNIASGTAGTNGSGNTSTIQSIGNGWYRIALSRASVNSLYYAFGLTSADNTQSGATGVTAYVWGAEDKAAPLSSYIPTVASTVTRALETLNFTVPAGKTTARVTYLDNTTQDFTRSPGAATITGAELTGTSFKIKTVTFLGDVENYALKDRDGNTILDRAGATIYARIV